MKKRPTKKAGASASARAKKPIIKKTAVRELHAEPIEIAPPKRGRGRPSSYDPAYCDRVIELGEEGKSKAQIASELGCSRKSLHLWMKVHEEFGEAMEEAQFRALAWWEDVGQAGLTMPKFNAALYAFNMKNRFRDTYADKAVDLVEEEQPAEREMSNLELARRIAWIFHQGMKEKEQQEQQQQEQQQASASFIARKFDA